MPNAVVVVDMQNGFMSSKGTLFCGDAARAIIDPIRSRVEQERGEGAAIFFTQDTHSREDKEFEMFPPHCISGTEDHEFIDELSALAADAPSSRNGATALFLKPTSPNALRR